MAKVKYDVTDVEDSGYNHAPVGTYHLEVAEINPRVSSRSKQDMFEVVFTPTKDASGKKLKESYANIYHYVPANNDNPAWTPRLKEFIAAFGLKLKGTLDTAKLVGQSVQGKLKADTDQDGEYRPRIGKLMGLPESEPEDAEDEDEDGADAAADEDEDDEEEEDEDDDEVSTRADLDDLDRDTLKGIIKENELEVRVKKSMSDDDLRDAIATVLELPAGGEDEEDEEEEDDDSPAYDEMSLPDIKALLKERGLQTSGTKKVLVQRLRKDDEDEEPF